MEVKKYKLGECLELQRGYDLTSSQMQGGKVAVVGSNGIIGYHNEERGNSPCITVGRSGSVGKVHYYEQPTWSHNTALFVKDFKGNNPKYLYYFLKNLHLDKMFEKGSSVIPSLDRKVVHSLVVPFHKDINDQRKIVAVLSAIDAKIELNHQINDNLEAMAKQLYDYWFVQFDFPNEEGKPYKSNGGAMVWNDKLKREIPQGWVVEKMGKCTNVLLGGTPDTNDNSLWGNGYNWLNSGEVAEFPILKSEKNITPKGLEKSATVLAPKGSVTLSITRHLRPSILCIDACINQSVVAILENDNISKEYIYPLLNRDIPRLMALRTGAQQPHINKETVEAINVVLPPANIMGAYINIAESIYNAIFNNAKEVEELTKQRDELLPLLMNGQASVNYHLSSTPTTAFGMINKASTGIIGTAKFDMD